MEVVGLPVVLVKELLDAGVVGAIAAALKHVMVAAGGLDGANLAVVIDKGARCRFPEGWKG